MKLKEKMGSLVSKYVYTLALVNSKILAQWCFIKKFFTIIKLLCREESSIVGIGSKFNNYQPIKDIVYIALNRSFFDKVKYEYIFVRDLME